MNHRKNSYVEEQRDDASSLFYATPQKHPNCNRGVGQEFDKNKLGVHIYMFEHLSSFNTLSCSIISSDRWHQY
jgi:hypothetical protein